MARPVATHLQSAQQGKQKFWISIELALERWPPLLVGPCKEFENDRTEQVDEKSEVPREIWVLSPSSYVEKDLKHY